MSSRNLEQFWGVSIFVSYFSLIYLEFILKLITRTVSRDNKIKEYQKLLNKIKWVEQKIKVKCK